jgi:hypothetical protein
MGEIVASAIGWTILFAAGWIALVLLNPPV